MAATDRAGGARAVMAAQLARLPAPVARPDLALMLGAAQGRLFVWVPLMLALGIALWFAQVDEPGVPAYGLAGLTLLVTLATLLRWPPGSAARLLTLAAALTAAGFLLTGWRAHGVAAPVLGWQSYGAIEGRITRIDRSARDRMRLTLDQVVIEGVPPARTPGAVRLALTGRQGALPPPGTRVMLTGSLSPPSGPSAPGSYDFRIQSWFAGLGAIGYSRAPVMVVAPAPPPSGLSGWMMAGDRLRMKLSAAMQERIGGQAGAVAAALMTGDRSGIAEVTNDAMRAANLYHVVSISGLHMGMLAGFVLAVLRLGFAASGLALHLPAHKIAAGVALLAAAIYLWLAGGDVATRRSFLMVAVMLLAVIADRRAISLRSLALAGLIVLLLEPESLIEPGFQMSFVATAALILSFGPWMKIAPRIPALLRPLAMLFVSSLIAGLSTAPIAAAHFNRMAEYGLLANLLVVPVMGAVVMPAGVIAGVLAPLGLAGSALWVMGLGTRWMLAVAEWIAGLNGAVTAVPAPGPWVLPLLGLGATVLVLMAGRARLAGLALMLAAFGLWFATPRPTLLIAPDGALIGVMTPEGRSLSRARAAGFVAETWLTQDGDTALQPEAAARPAFDGPQAARRAALGDLTVVALTGKTAPDRLAEACAPGVLIVSDSDLRPPSARETEAAAKPAPGSGKPSVRHPRPSADTTPDQITETASPPRSARSSNPPARRQGDCLVIDRSILRKTGAIAAEPGPDGWHFTTAAEIAGHRLWTVGGR